MGQDDVQAWQEFIKASYTYGLPFVFTASMLLLLLWVAIETVKILKKWVPLYVQNKIDSDIRIAKAMELIAEDVRCVHDGVHAIRSASIKAIDIWEPFLRKNKERLGIESDVLDKVRGMKRELEEYEQNRAAYLTAHGGIK